MTALYGTLLYGYIAVGFLNAYIFASSKLDDWATGAGLRRSLTHSAIRFLGWSLLMILECGFRSDDKRVDVRLAFAIWLFAFGGVLGVVPLHLNQ